MISDDWRCLTWTFPWAGTVHSLHESVDRNLYLFDLSTFIGFSATGVNLHFAEEPNVQEIELGKTHAWDTSSGHDVFTVILLQNFRRHPNGLYTSRRQLVTKICSHNPLSTTTKYFHFIRYQKQIMMEYISQAMLLHDLLKHTVKHRVLSTEYSFQLHASFQFSNHFGTEEFTVWHKEILNKVPVKTSV